MTKHKSLNTWQLIRKSVQQNQPVLLLYVLESHGSSPGRQGFLMAVNAGSEVAGSIGGGIMEHKFVELAKEKLKLGEAELSVRTQYHDKTAVRNQSGMICSGDQTILLYRIQANDAPVIEAIVNCLELNQNGLLTLSPDGIQLSTDPLPGVDYAFTLSSETDWLYQEKLGFKNSLCIIGGGHCALALSQLMSRMDFYIRIYDDRSDLHTLAQNDAVHEKILVQDYAELTHLIPSGPQQYVVVMTVGYRTDERAIRALLDKQFRYFGVLGSKTKVSKLFAGLQAEGVPADVLQRIHAPIGLAINSQTPEEIAISIAAEIIREKNRN